MNRTTTITSLHALTVDFLQNDGLLIDNLVADL